MNEMLRLANPPHESELDTVPEQVVMEIWRTDAGRIRAAAARVSGDDVIRAFAASLDDAWSIVDLRNARIVDGFSWGRYGRRTRVTRHGTEPVFAVESKSRLRRLFGR